MPMTRILAAAAVLLVSLSTSAAAQTPARPATGAPLPVTPPPRPVAPIDLDARATREQLRELMQRFPPDLGRVLKMDPTLLGSETYLAQYPALASFLAAHPDVAHNPAYYLQFVQIDREDWQPVDARTESMRLFRDTMESIGAFCIWCSHWPSPAPLARRLAWAAAPHGGCVPGSSG